MGSSKSKQRIANNCGCRSSSGFKHKDHCCLLECFSKIKQYQEMQHLYWIIPITIQTPLYEALKYYNAEFLTNTIIQYLPELKFKKSTYMPKKAKQNYVHNARNSASCHVYIHANISWIYNKTKPPCTIWCNNHGDHDWDTGTYKACIMGDGGVGKSSLVIRHLNDCFVEEYDPTISDCYRKQFTINPDIKKMDINWGSNSSKHKSQSVVFDYLDCAGQEEFAALTDHWIREGDIFFVCFSIIKRSSLESVKRLRDKIYTIRNYDPSDTKLKHNAQEFGFILVATKCDLINQRQVTTEEAMTLAKKWRVPYFETSSKEDVNVNFMFRQSVYEYWVQNQTHCSVDV